MTSKIIKDTEEVFFGVTDIFIKALKGLILSFILFFISRFLDVVFGFSYFTNEQIIILIILSFSFYHSFISYKKFNAFYIAGWIVGIYAMVFFDFIDSSKALIYILIPIVIISIRKLLFHSH
jgi:hypothetical protein